MSEPSRDVLGEHEPETDPTSQLKHVTVERADVAVCTMFPKEIGDGAVATRWITATADSFVSLEQRG